MARYIELRNCRTGKTKKINLGIDWKHLLTFPILGGAFGLHTLIKYRLVIPSLVQALVGTVLIFIYLRYSWDVRSMIFDHRVWWFVAADFAVMIYLSAHVGTWAVNKHLHNGWSLIDPSLS